MMLHQTEKMNIVLILVFNLISDVWCNLTHKQTASQYLEQFGIESIPKAIREQEPKQVLTLLARLFIRKYQAPGVVLHNFIRRSADHENGIAIKLLLEQDPAIIELLDYSLRKAALANDNRKIRWLLSLGARSKAIGEEWHTVAQERIHENIGKFLAKNEYRMLEQDCTALHHFLSSRQGVFGLKKEKYMYDLVLREAARFNDFELCYELLHFGADAQDHGAVFYAASAGNHGVIPVLLDFGYMPHRNHETSLMFACKNDDFDSARLLLELGARNSEILGRYSSLISPRIMELVRRYETSPIPT